MLMWEGLKHKRALKVAKQQARSNSILKQFHTLEMYMLALLVTLSYLQSYVYGLSKFVLEELRQESNNRILYIFAGQWSGVEHNRGCLYYQ